MSRVYFHIDLNAFYANAEILLDPSLKGKPIAVSGTTRRSVVATASYEARTFGVHSAMPIAEARQLCPDLIIIPGHFSWYEELSNQFIHLIRTYTDEMEQASVDECYADMTEPIMHYQKPLDLAWRIQKQILNEIGLPCSIGVGPNLFLAKMASDMKKPMGITVLRIKEVPEKLWPLAIGEMRGVGNKTVPYLEDLGIHTIGDLANYQDLSQLRILFGKNTDELIRRAHGYDDREIVKDWDAKSMGASETLLDDINDYDEIRGIIRSLSRTLSKRLKNDHKLGYTLSLRIKYFNFRNTDRSMKLEQPIWHADDIFVRAIDLFDKNWDGESIRLLGVSVSDFADQKWMAEQIDLFNETESMKDETAHVIQELNHQLTGGKLILASEKLKENDNEH